MKKLGEELSDKDLTATRYITGICKSFTRGHHYCKIKFLDAENKIIAVIESHPYYETVFQEWMDAKGLRKESMKETIDYIA